MNIDEAEIQQAASRYQGELDALQAIPFSEYEAVVRKWMLVEDAGVIKLLPALYIANQLERDPVWMMFIGPSGGGKTELLGCLLDLKDMFPISLLTTNSFLSGFPGLKDASLLPKVNGKIMIFKDWTSILSMNKDARHEILGQLREIYDGHLKKPYGNGVIREWKGKVGLIAGCTPAVDIAAQMTATLGERFISYRIAMPDRKKVASRCLENGFQVEVMRKEMKMAMYAFMKGVDIKKASDELSQDVKEQLIRVANLATLARSGVIRDMGFKKEVMFVPASEMPTRLIQQLSTIASALTALNGGILLPSDMKILNKIALDSIPQTNRMVMMQMAKSSEQDTATIARAIGYPTGPIHMYLENLALLGVCRRIRGLDSEEGGNADRWQMTLEFARILLEEDGYVFEDTPLDDPDGVDVAKEFSPP